MGGRRSSRSSKLLLLGLIPALALGAFLAVRDSRSANATASPTDPPARTWVEVGRWRGSSITYTANFTVQGPWRIRWQLSADSEPCQVMIVDGSANSPLLTGASGATTGVFSLQAGGTYSLMLHNTIPYEIVVEDFR